MDWYDAVNNNIPPSLKKHTVQSEAQQHMSAERTKQSAVLLDAHTFTQPIKIMKGH
jgi:hypothetical protein